MVHVKCKDGEKVWKSGMRVESKDKLLSLTARKLDKTCKDARG